MLLPPGRVEGLTMLLPPGWVEGTRGCCHPGGWGAHNAAATWEGGGD